MSEVDPHPSVKETRTPIGRLFEHILLEEEGAGSIEFVRRPPGVRLIIADVAQDRILLTSEFRRELRDWDWRLPGGKIFDSREAWQAYEQSGGDIIAAASAQGIKEAAEEAGMAVVEPRFLQQMVDGATVEWDLYYFVATQWAERSQGPQPEAGEQFRESRWFDYSIVESMIADGEMHEARSALAVLQWLNTSD